MTNDSKKWGVHDARSSVDNGSGAATRWALRMIPTTALSVLVAFIVGNLLMHATGTPEGALLTSSGFAGWVSWVVVLLLMISAPLAGVVMAVVARRHDRGRRSSIALYVNGLLLLWFLLSSIANVLL